MVRNEQKQLNDAVKRLRLAHKYGKKIINKLDAGGKRQYREVGHQSAAKEVCEELEVSFSEASARHYATFARKFTGLELDELIRDCRRHKHVPSFDVVVRLIGVQDETIRNNLIQDVLVNGWNKIRLGQEMRRINATSSFVDRDPVSQLERRSRGRYPKAVSSIESLVGELHDDAIKWRRIHTILMKRRKTKNAEKFGAEVPVQLMKDIRRLAEGLQVFFDWELLDE